MPAFPAPRVETLAASDRAERAATQGAGPMKRSQPGDDLVTASAIDPAIA